MIYEWQASVMPGSEHHEARSMKPREVRVKNAFVPRAGTREAEAVMPSRVRVEPDAGTDTRTGLCVGPCHDTLAAAVVSLIAEGIAMTLFFAAMAVWIMLAMGA